MNFIRNSVLSFFLASMFITASAQTSINYAGVDEFVRAYPVKLSATGDIRVFARELKRQFRTDDELVRAAFYWITHNISYDCDGYRQKNGLYELNDVLSRHKGICAGYASLMKFFCDEMGVECIIVDGFAAGIGVTSFEEDSLQTNHAWNAVKINGQWKLVDATWGSGGANSDCTKTFPSFNEHYFYCKPEVFIITHFPDSARWQLLDTPYTRHQFEASIEKWKKISVQDEPKDSVIKRNIGETVRFTFERKDERNMISISVYGKDNQPTDIFDSLNVTDKGAYYYDFKVTKAGYYRVDVSIFYYTDAEKESVGTSIETYYLQVPGTNKKTGVMPDRIQEAKPSKNKARN